MFHLVSPSTACLRKPHLGELYLHNNQSSFLIYRFHCSIAYHYRPDTREVITRTVELWNKWARLSCYYSRV